MNHPISTTILVIGTDTYFCYLLSRYVRESAHELMISPVDQNAVEVAQREKPVLIIIEDTLIKMKGREIIEEFKANQTTCQIPLVSCSWHHQEADEGQSGADYCLHMPILFGDFKAILDDLGI
jgi:CheY-like chemotaxis protein